MFEPRFYQLQEMLASLAPDPRFAERLYRLIDRHPPRIWVAGLGDAGEEIPVAVWIAEQAAGEGAGAVLLARLQDYYSSGEMRTKTVRELAQQMIETLATDKASQKLIEMLQQADAPGEG